MPRRTPSTPIPIPKKAERSELVKQLLSIGRGAIVAGVGAFLTYAITELGLIDYGAATPIVAAALAVLANIARKILLRENKEVKK